MKTPKRIAIFRMGHLGDMVVAMPALWTVRRRFPDARILFLHQEHQKARLAQGMEVLRRGTVYDDVLSYRLGSDGVSKFDMISTLVRLKLRRIDMLVYIPASRSVSQVKRDRLFFRLAGVKQIVGMTGFVEIDDRPLGNPLPTVPHVTDVLMSHLERDGLTPDVPRIELIHLGLSDEERAFARDWLVRNGVDLSRPVVGVGPGSKMSAKLWPVERFVEVAQKLDREFRPAYILFGSPPESDLCQEVVDSVETGVNAAGRLTVRQSAAVFEHCQLYLGNDTGTMHLAASAGVRCVAIFAARDWPGRWWPYGKGHRVFRHAVPCEGCQLTDCDRGNLCLLEVGATEVAAAAVKILHEVLC